MPMEFIAGDLKESMERRGLTFDMILKAPRLDFIENPARKNQKYLVVKIQNRAVLVPCKKLEENRWLMVTAWFDRKFTKAYLK